MNPTLTDTSLEPPGKHKLSCFVQNAQNKLAPGLDRDTEKEKIGDKERLARAGLIVVNPPYCFVEEMRAAFSIITKPLAAQTDIAWLAGG